MNLSGALWPGKPSEYQNAKESLEKKLIEFFRCEQSSVARSPSSFVSPSAIASAFATHFTLLVTPKFIYTFLLAKPPSSPPNFRASPR